MNTSLREGPRPSLPMPTFPKGSMHTILENQRKAPGLTGPRIHSLVRVTGSLQWADGADGGGHSHLLAHLPRRPLDHGVKRKCMSSPQAMHT
jgi:hypothetical protein